jgi:hypothetical protein
MGAAIPRMSLIMPDKCGESLRFAQMDRVEREDPVLAVWRRRRGTGRCGGGRRVSVDALAEAR